MTGGVFLLFLVCISCSFAQDEYEPICNTDNFMTDPDDPALPLFPDQFFYSMEANLVERNTTTFASEYLDELGNRGRFDFISSGSKATSIYDYDLGEAFVFPNVRTGQDCSVSLLTTNTTNRAARFLFGIIPGENNTVHIGAPSYIFYNGINMSLINYMGLDNSTTTRGIPSYNWQTCVTLPNNSFTLDYYFTDNSLWTNNYAVTGYIPVTVVLRGRRVSNGMIINTEHYYNFVEYRTGSEAVPDEVFMVPTGLICAGRIPGKPLPVFPNFFSIDIETVSKSSQNETTITGVQVYKEFYDLTHGLFRLDGYFPTLFNGSFTIIQDFNADAQHIIHPDFGYCMTSPLTIDAAFFDAYLDSDGNLRLRTAQELFYAQDKYQYIYEGVTTVRGLEADVWIAQNFTGNLTTMNITYFNIVYQLYFSRPGQIFGTLHSITAEPVLLQATFVADIISVNGTISSIDSRNSFYAYSPTEPPLDVFDVSPCFTENDSEDLRMRLNVNVTHFNQNNFRQSIRQSIVDYSKTVGMPLLSPLQVSSIFVHLSSDNLIHIHVHISNVSVNATKKWPYSAGKLVERILQGVQNGDSLPFKIRIGNTDFTAYYYSNEEPAEADESRLSNGVVAGISIATFVCGIVVGVVAIVFVHLCFALLCKRKGNANLSSARYEHQLNS